MADNTINTIKLGYGAYGCVVWHETSLLMLGQSNLSQLDAFPTNSGQFLFLTSANINVQFNRTFQKVYKTPRDTTNVHDILTNVGTCNITGSISFDMSRSNLQYILDAKYIKRNTYFTLFLSDGNKKYVVKHCVWNNINITTQVGGILTCTIGYVALNGRITDIIQHTYKMDNTYFDNSLVAYWQAGAGNKIQSFNLNFTQQVNPVYLNNEFVAPTYLRCGMVGINASFESWDSWQDLSEFYIGNKKIKFNNKIINVKQFSMSGATDIGKHNYQIASVAIKKSTQQIFTITNGV